MLHMPAVHFKLSKIPGREELMEQLHDVMYKRKGQVGSPLGFTAAVLPADMPTSA